MFTSLSNKLNKKNTSVVLLGLLALVIFIPNVTHADLVDKFLFNIVTGVFGWMVWLSGMTLDYAINSMVIGFGDIYSTQGLGRTIDTLWVTVRDIFNLTFIFGLVFIGLRMIFGSDSNTKKLLVNIILAALLVNFSLFITKFVVDFSNIAAVQLVNSFPVDSSGKPSISGDFAQMMGLTSILDYSTKSGAEFDKVSGGGLFGYIFGMMFLYIITSFVFFAGAFLLIIRFVVLNIYMVLSPIMFIGWVFPSMAKYSSEYWSGFLSRCFVAPAYILMLYFSAKVLATFSLTGSGRGSLSQLWLSTGPASFSEVFPPLVLSAIFLIASVVVAQKMSATGGSAVISMQDKLMKKTRGAVQGAAMISGRIVTKPVRDGAKKGSSYIGGKATQQINKWQAQAHANASATGASRTAKVVGWAATNNAVDKTARGASAWVTNTQWGTGTTQKADDEYRQKTKNRAEETAKVIAGTDPKNVAELARLRKQDKDSKATPPTAAALTPVEETKLLGLEKAEQDMQSVVAGLSTSRLEEMSTDELKAISPHLTAAQTEKLMASDKISSADKKAIGNARFEAIENVVGKAGSVLSAELTKLSIEQIESMGDTWINDNAHLFSNTQMDDLKKSKKYTESQKNKFVGTRKTRHKEASDTGSSTFTTTDSKTGSPVSTTVTNQDLFTHNDSARTPRKPEEIAALGKDVLLSPMAVPFITRDVLEIIGEKKTLTNTERVDLLFNVLMTTPHLADINAYLATSHGARFWS